LRTKFYQIAVMNAAYSKASITWVLAGTSRTTNSDWFNNVGPDASQQTARIEDRSGERSQCIHSWVRSEYAQVPFCSNGSKDSHLVPVLAFSVIRRSLRISHQTPRMTVLLFSSLLFLKARLRHTISAR